MLYEWLQIDKNDTIPSYVKISMISLISSLSLELYLNSLLYHRNIFRSSSKVFGNLRQSSDIFVNFRKFSENVRERSSGLWNNFGKSSEIFRKWLEIFRKSSKNTVISTSMKASRYEFYILVARTIQYILFLPLKHKIHIIYIYIYIYKLNVNKVYKTSHQL